MVLGLLFCFIPLLIQLVSRVQWLFRAHLGACTKPFDAPREITLANKYELILVEKSRFLSKNSKFFIAPFLLYVVYILDSLWLLYKHDFNYPWDPMPDLFCHKVFPRMFWLNSDVILNVGVGGVFFMYYFLCTRQFINERYCMYLLDNAGENGWLIVNRQVWDRANTATLLKLRNFNRRIQKYAYFVTVSIASAYFDYHFFNREWIFGWRDWFHFVVILHPMIWYNISAMVFMYFHFFLSASYVIVKQRLMLRKLRGLVYILHDPRKRERHSLPMLWYEFHSVNGDLAYQCNKIRAYNRFWGVHLTMQFLFAFKIIIIICYFVYCNLFFFKQASFEAVIYFVVFPVEIGFLMFLVIFVCTWVDRNNTNCYALNVQAASLFQFHFRMISRRMLASIETIATNRNLNKCCFRLANGYRIDATAFNLAIYIISTLFVMLVKRSEYYQKGKDQ